MPGNTFGRCFCVTTFGESHGEALGALIDGCPAGVKLFPDLFASAMARRRPGCGSYDTPRKEEDRVEIVSGVFEDRSTGAPILLLIRNRDAASRPYEPLRRLFRPGHGDFTYFKKYGHFDHRGGGRYSGRETAARVAAGVVAQQVLAPSGISVSSYTLELGAVRINRFDPSAAEQDPLRCPDPQASQRMQEALEQARLQGDSLGGVVEIRACGCPAGLGEPVFDKLDADLAKAVMSVGAVKGVEIGSGFKAARLRGSENNDPLVPGGFASNHAGGILAGISNGDEIVLRAAAKPIPSIAMQQQTVDRSGQPRSLQMTGRFDVCVIPRILPVLEAMVKIVLADHLLRSRMLKQEKGFQNQG